MYTTELHHIVRRADRGLRACIRLYGPRQTVGLSHTDPHTHTSKHIYTLTQTRIQMKEAKRILSNDNPTHFLSVLAVHFKGCSVCQCVCVKDFGKAVLFNVGTSFMAAFDRDIKTFIMNTFTSRPSEVIQLSFYRKPQKDQPRTL